MSNKIDQENPSINDDSTVATIEKERGEHDDFWSKSCKVRNFFTYRGLNQHLQACSRKSRDIIVIAS